MKFISHGAAREVTGSCHELQIGDKRILLDCGLFQGRRKEAIHKNNFFPFDPGKDIDAMILSHAHMDHAGRIPLLWKRGYRGPIHCTYATRDLAGVMLADGGYIQEKDEEYFCSHLWKTMLSCDGPLYTQKDAVACMDLFQGKNYGTMFEVVPGVRAQFLDAGHVLGAAMVILEIDEEAGGKRIAANNKKVATSRPSPVALHIAFTGDLGRDSLPIIRDPVVLPPVEILICESTYGDRSHEDVETARHHLQEVIVRTAKRGGKVFIPAFSLERTQEIVYDLHLLWDEGAIPAIPIIIDSPLASRVTEIFLRHPECYDKEVYDQFLSRGHNPFQFSLVRFTANVEESKALNNLPGPAIIMAGSGMCEAGRIRHHLRHSIEDPRNTVVAVGFMAEHTLGRRIIEPSIRSVRIFDEEFSKKAEVVVINAYSAHADCSDLDRFIGRAVHSAEEHGSILKKLFLVHGEERVMNTLMARTHALHPALDVILPERGIANRL